MADYVLKDINPDYALNGIKSPDALRAAADTVEACAIGDVTDALLVLFARMVERKALGLAMDDEVRALVRLMRAG